MSRQVEVAAQIICIWYSSHFYSSWCLFCLASWIGLQTISSKGTWLFAVMKMFVMGFMSSVLGGQLGHLQFSIMSHFHLISKQLLKISLPPKDYRKPYWLKAWNYRVQYYSMLFNLSYLNPCKPLGFCYTCCMFPCSA